MRINSGDGIAMDCMAIYSILKSASGRGDRVYRRPRRIGHGVPATSQG
ncbi:MAG: hypothetical protein Q8M31_05350 [Beijerinckiaceae bacterium]|nr:hypothetical protein [Beijerinckiaceae bacterium]